MECFSLVPGLYGNPCSPGSQKVFHISLLHAKLMALWHRDMHRAFNYSSFLLLMKALQGASTEGTAANITVWRAIAGQKTANQQHREEWIQTPDTAQLSLTWSFQSRMQTVWLECFFEETRTGKDLAGGEATFFKLGAPEVACEAFLHQGQCWPGFPCCGFSKQTLPERTWKLPRFWQGSDHCCHYHIFIELME